MYLSDGRAGTRTAGVADHASIEVWWERHILLIAQLSHSGYAILYEYSDTAVDSKRKGPSSSKQIIKSTWRWPDIGSTTI